MTEIYVDGASLGNPGSVGAGYLILRQGRIIKQEGVFLGQNTNNFAEYMAFILALIEARNLGVSECTVYSDSQLLCEQLNGRYRVKHGNIIAPYTLAKRMISLFQRVEIRHVPREKNSQADALAKDAAARR